MSYWRGTTTSNSIITRLWYERRRVKRGWEIIYVVGWWDTPWWNT